ncbi:MAG: glycine cleavage system aminomethyltransferase GcvT [Lachnospiraceae bacterium]|nr:glycine cleavage system aminomethyltransferase GcvT [Lachnospiraceae bacterium]
MDKKTPLYEEHVRLGGKIVSFGGYALPVQYGTGIVKEHMAVREQAGLFDVSHMGEFELKGPDSVKNLNRLLTNDYTEMEDGRCRYMPMCYPDGGTVDDLIVAKRGENDYFLVVNASNREKDFAWMSENLQGDVVLRDVSDDYAEIALQGPASKELIRKLSPSDRLPKKYYTAVFDTEIAGVPAIISRTGYTGEFGYEIYVPACEGPKVWQALLREGEELGVIPCGLGARDTLRLEAGMPLYGHEMNEKITPLEADLGFAVKLEKDDFIGKEALLQPMKRMRVGLRVTGRGILREELTVLKDGREIGVTTSGTFAPFLKVSIANALVEAGSLEIGDKVQVDVRGRLVEAEVVPLPFYKRAK